MFENFKGIAYLRRNWGEVFDILGGNTNEIRIFLWTVGPGLEGLGKIQGLGFKTLKAAKRRALRIVKTLINKARFPHFLRWITYLVESSTSFTARQKTKILSWITSRANHFTRWK